MSLTQQIDDLEQMVAQVRTASASVTELAQQIDTQARVLAQELDDVFRHAAALEAQLTRLHAENQQLREQLAHARPRTKEALLAGAEQRRHEPRSVDDPSEFRRSLDALTTLDPQPCHAVRRRSRSPRAERGVAQGPGPGDAELGEPIAADAPEGSSRAQVQDAHGATSLPSSPEFPRARRDHARPRQ